MNELRIEKLRVHHVGPIDLAVSSDECVGISGPSGSGKTLLLRAVADMIPHEGTVSLNGQANLEMNGSQWRQRVGLLPSESAWWYDTVGPHFASMEKHALEFLGFPPDVADWDIRRLSSGERQRLALLRLLSNHPDVLLLDEPTANLDPQSSERVELFIDRFRRRHACSIIWISHQAAQLARVAGKHYRLENGRLIPTRRSA